MQNSLLFVCMITHCRPVKKLFAPQVHDFRPRWLVNWINQSSLRPVPVHHHNRRPPVPERLRFAAPIIRAEFGIRATSLQRPAGPNCCNEFVPGIRNVHPADRSANLFGWRSDAGRPSSFDAADDDSICFRFNPHHKIGFAHRDARPFRCPIVKPSMPGWSTDDVPVGGDNFARRIDLRHRPFGVRGRTRSCLPEVTKQISWLSFFSATLSPSWPAISRMTGFS